ncbi:ABC transporter ATP-binding protein [Companilactobacillus sp. HBUAS56257]|uniref:ABC transporter ATP-binding protein n=1 Tax=Companilactobacillus sp. HBUAS56257 TaxID=3109360 RepID=UPI002FF27089
MEKIISVEHLVKNYDNHKAVNDLNFSVEKGSFTAFLGANGAGKSTTISILTTLLKSTSGQVKVAGFKIGTDDAKIREQIGVVFQSSILDNLLTPKEILETRGKLYNLSKETLQDRINNLRQLLDMSEFFNRHYELLSGGQRRRVDIARALIHEPAILFLDEPTTGLDPLSRRQVWNTIEKLRKNQHLTIFLTTHYMEEVDNADKVLIISNGQLRAMGTPYELKKKFARNTLDIMMNDKKETIYFKETKAALNYLENHFTEIDDFEYRHGSMDDVFLNVTNGEKQYDD